jgi:two-component system, LuxR family, response regulator FixJ
MKPQTHKVFIIDDDEPVRRSISLLLKSSGYPAESFQSAAEFLESVNYPGTGCILLDVFLEGESGLDLQDKIKARFPNLPIIYISGQGDIPMSVKVLRNGALNFLQKPIDIDMLIQAVQEAMDLSPELVAGSEKTARIKGLLDTLTPREHAVFSCLITGMLNKQIASELDIAEHTVKIHRGKITSKLGVKSVAEMVLMAEWLKLS